MVTIAAVSVGAAEPVAATTTLALRPSENWLGSGARFAAYFFETGSPEVWADMTAQADGTYTVEAPADYANVIFCRMNGASTENAWANKWNQSPDLLVADGANAVYVITDWNNGEWQEIEVPTTEEPAMEEPVTASPAVSVYFRPSANWEQDDARFAIWVAGWKYNSTEWFALTAAGNGVYTAEIPDGNHWVSCKFARLNPETTGFDTPWNVSAEVGFEAGRLYTLNAGEWDNATGSWSDYDPTTEPVTEAPVTEAPVTEAPVTEAPATEAPATEEPATEAPAGDVYIVAGAPAAIFGVEWDGTAAANAMTLTEAVYAKTYTVDKAYSEVQLKVVKNGTSWYGTEDGANVAFALSGAGIFTVTYNPADNGVSVSGDIVGEKTEFTYDEVYAAGNGDGAWLNGVVWDPGAAANKLTEVADDVWEISFDGVPAGNSRQFKFTLDGTWFTSFGGTFRQSGTVTNAVNNGSNITFNVAKASTVKLQLDLRNYDPDTKQGATFTVTITETGDPSAPDEPTTAEPVEEAYYLVGSVNEWSISDDYKFVANEAAEGEYVLENVALTAGAQFKVKGADGTWYPDGMNNNYVAAADGTYTVYFRPDGQGGAGWHNGYFYVASVEPATEEPATGEPATEEPTTEPAPVAYYVVGTMNNWTVAEYYKLTANPEAEGEYALANVALEKDAELKVQGTDGAWYPDGMNNNYVVAADGTYTIYFRPDGQGGADWHCGVIYLAATGTPEDDRLYIDGKPAEGFVNNKYYIDGYAQQYTGAVEIDGVFYLFNENNECEGVCDGIYGDRYFVEGVPTYAGLIQIDEYFYYAQKGGYLVIDQDYTVYNSHANGLLPRGTYHFDEEGKMEARPARNGIFNGVYYVDDVPTYAGLILIGSEYYYAGSKGILFTDGTMTLYNSHSNGLLPRGEYTFDAEGKLIKNGIVNGVYYEDNEPVRKGVLKIGNDYYFAGSKGVIIKDREYFVGADYTNGLIPRGKYLFDANGKIIINDRNGIDNGIYYVNGVATYAGVVYIDGYYYYADSKGVIFKNGTKQIFSTRANNLLQPGVYTFDADGRITDAEGRVIQEDYIAEQ